MDDIAKSINARVEQEIDRLRTDSNNRLQEMEKTIAEEVKRKTEGIIKNVTWVFAGLILAILGTISFSVYSASRDVNDRVIELQNGVISAQTVIRDSNRELAEQTKRLSEANSAMAAATRALETSAKDLADAKAKLASAPATAR